MEDSLLVLFVLRLSSTQMEEGFVVVCMLRVEVRLQSMILLQQDALLDDEIFA